MRVLASGCSLRETREFPCHENPSPLSLIRHHLLGSLFIAPRLPRADPSPGQPIVPCLLRAVPSPRQPIDPCLPLAVPKALRPLIVPLLPLAAPIVPRELEASTVPHPLQAPICARPSARSLGLRRLSAAPLEPMRAALLRRLSTPSTRLTGPPDPTPGRLSGFVERRPGMRLLQKHRLGRADRAARS